MIKLAFIVIVLFVSFSSLIADEIGIWGFTSKGLPTYQYKGWGTSGLIRRLISTLNELNRNRNIT